MDSWLQPGSVVATIISSFVALFLWLQKRQDARLSVADGPFGQLNKLLEQYRKRIEELELQNKSLTKSYEAQERRNEKLVESLDIQTGLQEQQAQELKLCQLKIQDLKQLVQGVQTSQKNPSKNET